MNKAQALETLHCYAEWRRNNPTAWPRFDRESPAYLEALSHGAAAVKLVKDCEPSYADVYADTLKDKIRREARAAAHCTFQWLGVRSV